MLPQVGQSIWNRSCSYSAPHSLHRERAGTCVYEEQGALGIVSGVSASNAHWSAKSSPREVTNTDANLGDPGHASIPGRSKDAEEWMLIA